MLFRNSDQSNPLMNNYLPVFQRLSNQINWSVLFLAIIVATNLFLTIDWHFGTLKSGLKREEKIIQKLEKKLLNLKARNNSIFAIGPKLDEYNNLKNKLGERKRYFDALNSSHQETLNITFPVLGIKFHKSDFMLFNTIFGLIFAFFIYYLLQYSKTVLKKIYNNVYSVANIREVVPDIFYLVYPSRRKFYRYIELLILIYIFSILILFISDLIDLYVSHPRVYEGLLSEDSAIGDMKLSLVYTFLVLLICLTLSCILFYNSFLLLRSFRNILILFEWTQTSLVKALCKSLNYDNNDISYEFSIIEYRERMNGKGEKLLIYPHHYADKLICRIEVEINLPRSLKHFFDKDPNIFSFLDETDLNVKDYKRVDFDEVIMLKYFERIMTVEESLESDLYKSISQNRNKNIK